MADVPKLITIDFETYYDKEYSLSKMTTEAYVRDPRFQAIGAAIKFGGYPTDWIPGPDLRRHLEAIDWSDKMVLAHNTAFDGAIMAWHYGIQPAMWLDTMSMARPKHGLTIGCSLSALAKHYELGEKGTEVVQALGKRLEDFTPAELAQYGRYCINDVELEYALFKTLVKGFPVNELRVIDMMLRMFINPVLELDKPKLEQHLANVKARKAELMTRIEVEKEVLMSDDKFAAALEALGVEPPTKLSAAKSKTKGEDVYVWAFAKTDTDFIELLEHDDFEVQALVAARIGNKTTIEETRTERLIGISERGPLPIMLNYYGGHTGRASGGDKINPQNFSAERNNKGGEIRAAIEAPDGHLVCAGDSSQIECRLTAYMAGQQDLLEDFRNKRDIYSLFATDIYGREITKANKTERHVGKTCILGLGYQTGAKKLRHTLASKDPRVYVDLETAKSYVDTYRMRYHKIPMLWTHAQQMLEAVCFDAGPYWIGPGDGLIYGDSEGIHLPNGMLIRYPGLEYDGREYTYQNRRKTTKIYGGAVTENFIQALARIVVFDQMLEIDKRLKARRKEMGWGTYCLPLTVHDEAVAVVPDFDAEWCKSMMEEIMSTPPAWAPTLPIACEVAYGKAYGDAK